MRQPLVSLRLSGDLVRRFRARRAPELAAWAAGLAAYSLAAGALAWGAAAGWSEAAFRVYYLGGGLLTAALLGAGSLLLVGRRWVAPVALVYVGLAVGVALAVPLQGASLGDGRCRRRRRSSTSGRHGSLAILGNSLGTLAVVVVAVATFRPGRSETRSILAGIAVAAVGSGLAGLGVGALAPAIAVAAVLLYAGFVTPRRLVVSRNAFAVETALAEPDRHEHADDRQRDERLDDRAGQRPRGPLATREQPHPAERVQHHEREHRELRLERGEAVFEHRDCAIMGDREPGDVPDDERGDLDVPHRLGRHDREVRREVGRAEEVPAAAERVGDERDDELAR